MLNPIPELLTYGLMAPLILRAVIGYIFLNLGFLKLTREKGRWNVFFGSINFNPASFYTAFFGLIEVVGGIFFIAGFGVQITALVFSIITLGELFVENKEPSLLKRDLVFYLFVLAISVSLLFSGAGFLAVDFPL